MFLHVSVILFTWGGGGIPACIVGGITSYLAAGLQQRGGGISACLAGLQAHTQVEVEGSGQGRGLHPTPGGSPGPHLGVGGIPACTEADPPTATAAGGTHPTGMHSCYSLISPYN